MLIERSVIKNQIYICGFISLCSPRHVWSGEVTSWTVQERWAHCQRYPERRQLIWYIYCNGCSRTYQQICQAPSGMLRIFTCHISRIPSLFPVPVIINSNHHFLHFTIIAYILHSVFYVKWWHIFHIDFCIKIPQTLG